MNISSGYYCLIPPIFSILGAAFYIQNMFTLVNLNISGQEINI